MLTRERLTALLDYCHETGEFRHRTSHDGVRAGAVAGTLHHTGYRLIRADGRRYKASWLAWLWINGRWPVGQIDHRDCDRTNDRIDNLREATPSQNGANKPAYSNNIAGIKGVHPFRNRGRPTGRWRAQIKKDGRVMHLGLFDTPEEAGAAYAAAAARMHGEFHRI